MSSLNGGGAEKALLTMLHHFDYSHFSVELCLISKCGIYLDEIPNEVKIIALYNNPTSLWAKIDYNFYSHCQIDLLERNRIRKKIGKKYDAIISFCEGRSLKFHSYVTDRTPNNITWVHTDIYTNHYTIGKPFTIPHELKAYSAMQTIVFVSKDAQKQFERTFPKLKNINKQVIYNPIDRNLILSYKKHIPPHSTFKIICIGGLRKVKAFDRAVRLASQLKSDNIDFQIDIIGEGNGRNELKSLIHQYSVNDKVSLLGFRNPPYRELATADLFLSTSIAEGFPLVHCEALCLGIPIVSTRCTGSQELLEDNKYGIIVEQNDKSIYQGVKNIIHNEVLRKHYQNKAMERAEIFNLDTTMKNIYKVINSLKK